MLGESEMFPLLPSWNLGVDGQLLVWIVVEALQKVNFSAYFLLVRGLDLKKILNEYTRVERYSKFSRETELAQKHSLQKIHVLDSFISVTIIKIHWFTTTNIYFLFLLNLFDL